MAFLEHRPDGALASHVDSVWTSTHEHDATGTSRILPDGCVEIVVTLEGQFALAEGAGRGRAPRVTVVGQNTRPLDTWFHDCHRMVGIRLTPAGALRLLGDALPHIVNATADAADIDPRLTRDVAEAVELSATSGGAALERALRPAIERARPVDRRVEEASMMVCTSGGRASIRSVAAQVGLSTRQLDRSFERRFGLSPKLLGRISRFRRAFESGMPAARGDWAAIAASCGYADQAHLSRDFIEFAGQSPERMRFVMSSSDHV